MFMKYKGGDCTDISQDFFNPADEGMAYVCAAAGGAECTKAASGADPGSPRQPGSDRRHFRFSYIYRDLGTLQVENPASQVSSLVKRLRN